MTAGRWTANHGKRQNRPLLGTEAVLRRSRRIWRSLVAAGWNAALCAGQNVGKERVAWNQLVAGTGMINKQLLAAPLNFDKSRCLYHSVPDLLHFSSNICSTHRFIPCLAFIRGAAVVFHSPFC